MQLIAPGAGPLRRSTTASRPSRERTLLIISAIALVAVLVDWVLQIAGQRVTGRTGERLLYLLRVKTFAHLQRLGLDYYERELGGRIMTRMTTDIDALSNFLQTGLTTALISLLTLVGVLIALDHPGRRAVAGPGRDAAGACSSRPWRSGGGPCPAYVEARERISAVNAQFQENVAGVRVTQAFGREGAQQRAVPRRRPRATATRGCGPSATSRSTSRSSSSCPIVAGGAGARLRRDPARARHADRRRADRVLPLPGRVLLAGPAAVAGLRRLSAVDGRPVAGCAICCGRRPSTPAAATRSPVGGSAGRDRPCDDVRFAYNGAADRRREALRGVTLHSRTG